MGLAGASTGLPARVEWIPQQKRGLIYFKLCNISPYCSAVVLRQNAVITIFVKIDFSLPNYSFQIAVSAIIYKANYRNNKTFKKCKLKGAFNLLSIVC